ncbi:MAG: tRNA uridine-5-carboxymethylaminomethyl(34) synthesis GTPase MnmE [Desulfonatronovibrionaceae bacterium]
MNSIQDTIAAIATPPGRGALGIIRMSGSLSLSIARKIFSRPAGKALEPRRLLHGWIRNHNGLELDEVMLSWMPAPGSYTGEDVVEISCHGNQAILEAVLETLLAMGARLAQPGEFTKRAFLNNKMDLTRAEAVLEIINAPTMTGVELARQKLGGSLAEKIHSLSQKLAKLKQEMCLAVDFPEEDIQCLSREDLAHGVEQCLNQIQDLCAGYHRAGIWTQGVLVVLAGRVNAGKSSLLNAILGRERAIVADLPGTTRDFIEEAVNLNGLPVRLTDTAGLRETCDPVEQMGLETGRRLMDSADLIVYLLDASVPPEKSDLDFLKSADNQKLVTAFNKWDLITRPHPEILKLEKTLRPSVRISAREGTGLRELTDLIRNTILARQTGTAQDSPAPNLRQKICLEKCAEELSGLKQDALAGMPYDLLSTRLDYACWQLDQITGVISPQEVLNSIFDNFCIGK